MSLSMLFRSNVTAHAQTSEEFLKLTKKCMERVQKLTTPSIIFTSPKFNYGQCKYLADKLKLAVESAQYLSPEDFENCLEVFKLLHSLANAVENFIQSCCQYAWIQAAVMLTNVSEHISSLSFNLEVLAQSFLGRLILTTIDGVYQAEVNIVEAKASEDRETLLRVLNVVLRTRTSIDRVYQLAVLLLERLRQPMHEQARSMPRLFQEDRVNLIELEKLGKGSFATVFKASWQGIQVAKKTFYARDSPDFEKEVSILQGLSHANITSLLGYAKDDRECFMVMELMDEDLLTLIQRRMKKHKTWGFPFGILEALDIMLQIGRGMQYLHEVRIVHRDLKSMNILVRFVKTKDLETEYVLAKVSDFGLSKTKERSLTYSNQTPNIGTARWMAPEMIKFSTAERPTESSNNDAMVAKYPFSSDVHSFAMVCYEILTGEMPYFEVPYPNQIKEKVLKGDRPELPSHCPLNLKSLIERCWSADASKRPCFAEICGELRHLKCLLLTSRMISYQDGIYAGSSGQANITVSLNSLGLQPGRSGGGRKFTFAKLKKAQEDSEVNPGQLKRFTISQLRIATENFSTRKEIGRGGFGKVYKGVLSDGTLLAVKRLKEDRNLGDEQQFQTEVEIMSMAAHRNLLRLYGFCTTPSERLLVYPYMSNGSVSFQLKKPEHGEPALSSEMRKHIALGAAKGLAYLHEQCSAKIIHRDVQADNILLDDEFEAVVGDFGLAKAVDFKNTHITTTVRGTLGHIAPEYMSTGKLSEKTDVYGYGITLLQLITGQGAVNLSRLADDDDVMLLDWVKKLVKENKVELMVDPNLKECYMTYIKELLRVALLCTENSPSARPKMSEVVSMLEGNGLEERWAEWEKLEVIRNQEVLYMPRLPPGWDLVSNSSFLHSLELSGQDNGLSHSSGESVIGHNPLL